LRLITLFSLLLCNSALAEQYVCSYPSYSDNEPLIVNVTVNGDVATVGSRFPTEYRVLENNDKGLVLINSFSDVGDNSPKQNDIGLYGFIIDKQKMKMVRGMIAYGEDRSNLRNGSCIINF